MIQRLEIRGFRSLRDVSWEPGKLNVVIGPNASGKSNLLRALALLQHAATGDLPSQILRQGGITSILWDGQAPELSWHLALTPTKIVGFLPVPSSYSLDLRQVGAAGSSYYRVEREILKEQDPPPHGRIVFERHGARATLNHVGKAEAGDEGDIQEDQPLVSMMAGFLGASPGGMFRDWLRSWGIYHDVSVGQDAAIRQAAVARVETRVDADGQNLIPMLHTRYASDREFRRQIDAAMRAAFGDDFEELSFPPAADQRVQLRLRWRSLNTARSAVDLSDGTIRFLLLLAILANPEPGDLIAIDEPETGLHPAMLPIIAEFARDAAERTQVIFTTHSPQFLDAFGEHPPTVTVTSWSEGETHLNLVDGEELARFLKEYSLGALFRSGELEGMT